MHKENLNKITLDAADAISFDVKSAEQYLKENNVDVERFVSKGMKDLGTQKKSTPKLSKSQTFFRRVVLAAKITDECHREWTFGSVKFQKMVYLCEHVSKMNFSTNYSKQAAGPMDNKFIHAVKQQFEKQGWFSVNKVKNGKIEKVKFSPLEKVDNYKRYYSNYFEDVENEIQHLIDIFRKWKTNDVELVATIFACWEEFNSQNQEFTEEEMIDEIYKWNISKRKFSEQQIIATIQWMRESNIYPNN